MNEISYLLVATRVIMQQVGCIGTRRTSLKIPILCVLCASCGLKTVWCMRLSGLSVDYHTKFQLLVNAASATGLVCTFPEYSCDEYSCDLAQMPLGLHCP